MKRRELFLLLLILIIASFLRLYRLDRVPPHLDWDEVATGYNAYSISETGRDEYGRAWPVLFESFNDFKMPGYIYTLVPFVKIFGLSDFIVRLPSAIYGILTVLVTYFLAKEVAGYLFRDQISIIYYPVSAALLLAISPWHLQFSRVAFEGNGSLFFFILGLYLFLISLKRSLFLPLSFFVFSISLYFYYSVRLLIPALVITLIVIKRQTFLKNKAYFLTAVIIGTIISLPLLVAMAQSGGNERLNILSIVSAKKQILKELFLEKMVDNNQFSKKIFHNSYLAFAALLVKKFLINFSPSFLFLSGDPNARHSPSHMGVMYLFEAPFLLYGLYLLIKQKTKIKWPLLVWGIVGFLPTALSISVSHLAFGVSLILPHALRSLLILPLPQLLTAYGIISFMTIIKEKAWSKAALAFVVLLFIFNCLDYFDNYYIHYPRFSASAWADGHRQLWEYLPTVSQDHKIIFITGRYWQPYIFALYYLRYPPVDYQSNWDHGHFDKYYFGKSDWDIKGQEYYRQNFAVEKIAVDAETLIVAAPGEFKDLKIMKVIYNTKGEKVFEIGKII